MTARLIAEEGDLKGLILSLNEGDTWVIGRDPDECQLIVPDPLISRKHLIARRTPKGITVQNLSSANPIQVNKEEIKEQPRLLQQGDTIRIGNEVFRFYTDFLLDEASHAKSDDEDSEENLLEDLESEASPLAEINFGLADTGRWLLKVIGGPNNGAEFYMQTSHSYVLGTDPRNCDIVFQDTSVSRQHARITVTNEDTLFIEDLKSRNGLLVNGAPLESKQPLSSNVIVTMGTTSFVIYDCEGEMQTIISPLLPSIVKALQQQEENSKSKGTAAETKETTSQATLPSTQVKEPVTTLAPKRLRSWGSTILLSIAVGMFVLVGLGTASLFKSKPVMMTEVQENAPELIHKALAPFPAIKFTFNKASGGLLLLGHISTATDKSQLLYYLQSLKFIKSIDDTGIIIDEYVWQEFNSVLAKNPAWKGISLYSPAAGQFVLVGELQTRQQSEQLFNYMSLNFPYLDLLKKQVVVEEDILSRIRTWLQKDHLSNVTLKMINGEVTFTGKIPIDKMTAMTQVITKTKEIPGVRHINNLIKAEDVQQKIINLTGQYEVTGQSRIGNHYTVIINGRILSEKDSIDGMLITSITPNQIFLEKGEIKYYIDYK